MVRRWMPLALIFLLGLGLRIVEYRNKPCVSRDSALYIECAASPAIGNDIRAGFWRLPYICLLRIPAAAGWNIERFGVTVNILCGSLSAMLIVLVARRAAIPGGLWAELLAAVNPWCVDFSTETQREAPYILLTLAALYGFFAYLDTGTIWRLLLAVVALFGAFLLRVEALEPLAAMLLAAAAVMWRRKRRRAFFDFGLAAATALILFAGYILTIRAAFGLEPCSQVVKIMHSWRVRL